MLTCPDCGSKTAVMTCWKCRWEEARHGNMGDMWVKVRRPKRFGPPWDWVKVPYGTLAVFEEEL